MISPTCTAGICLCLPRSFLSRRLASQHQLGIFVYRGLDVHAHAMPKRAAGRCCRSFGRLDRNNARIGRRFSELWHHLLHGGVHRGGCVHPSVTPKITGLMGHRSEPCSFCPNLAFQRRSTHSPTWHGLDSQARVLFREITIRSYRLSLCTLPAFLLPMQHKHQVSKREHGHTPILSRRSQSSVGMPYRSTCSISQSF